MENQKEQPNERKVESSKNVHSQTEHTAHAKDKLTHRSDDAGYTERENQFADGKGTQLNEEMDSQQDQTQATDEVKE